MTTETIIPVGLVLYADGSFRQNRGGWGVHGYVYMDIPLKQGIGVKQLPTKEGYSEVPLPESVSVTYYIDAFGEVGDKPTNNTAELAAAIEAVKIAHPYPIDSVTILTDSEYVQKGFNNNLDKWAKTNWTKATGEPLANVSYWQELKTLKDLWTESNRNIVIRWVKGHSGNVGNDIADVNAKTGSGGCIDAYAHVSEATKYHNPEVETNPLIMKTRMLFNMGLGVPTAAEMGNYYYLYQLGRQGTYGHKQQDTTDDRHDKTDLLLGRRISDATFCVIKLEEPDPYLTLLQKLHSDAHSTDIVELAIARLDNAYRPSIYQRVTQMGIKALITRKSNGAILTPGEDLITKTLNPPRLAMEAVDQFAIMQRRMDELLGDKLGKGTTAIDITEHLYGMETEGKKPAIKLHKEITNTTPYVEVKAKFKDNNVVLKLILGVDIPQRNALARLSGEATRVTVMIVANGPLSYTFATVFQTEVGNAIFQSPYSQFVIPK